MITIIRNVSVVLCMFVIFSASAQDFKPFKVNLSLGYAAATGNGASGGVLFSLEPKYGITDQIDLGLRIEGAVVASGIDVSGSGSNTNGNAEVKGLGSYVATGTYMFTTTNFRPYVGAGVGLYSIAGTSVTITNGSSSQTVAVQAGTKPGFMLRAGFKAGHFNAGVEYNLVGNSTGVTLTGGQSVTGKNSYLGVELGFDIGGGRY